MASEATRILISAQIEGLPEVERLKSSIKSLSNVVNPASNDIDKLRSAAVKLGTANDATTRDLRTSISVLEDLKDQVSIGGKAYQGMARDLELLQGRLNAATGSMRQFAQAQAASARNPFGVSGRGRTQGQTQYQAPIGPMELDYAAANRALSQYENALDQIEQARNNSRLVQLQNEERANQQEQRLLDAALAKRLQAQQAAAAAEVAAFDKALQRRDLVQQKQAQAKNLFGLGGRDLSPFYQGVSGLASLREQAATQSMGRNPTQMLSDIVDAFSTQLERAGNGFLQSERELREAAIKFSGNADSVRRAFERTPRQTPAGMLPSPSETRRQYVQRVGVGADQVPSFGSFSRNSINELQAVRSSLQAFRADLNPLSVDFRRLEAQAVNSLRKIDRELERRESRVGGRGNRLAEFGQSAGATLAAGVFGGPEGFLGGAIGSLFGPAGAFAGGAVGAQVGMFRQQLGGFATYSSDIEKLQIALRGVTATQEEYQKGLAATAAVTRDFNILQLEATQGFTLLAASVIGAGGKVADAEVVFRNVTAAIKASGGTLEDVQGALLAVSQVFSKGKVSAEELSGQLGERLPGAVTMFAKATGRSLPQLKKDLEQGVVGLADFMKFVTSDQGLNQFPERAKTIADSSADSGARLTKTWNDVRLAIGTALQPIGAEIQNSLGRLLTEYTPALIATAKALASAIKFVVDNFGAIANIAKFAATLALVKVAAGALPGVLGSAKLAVAALGTQFGLTSAQALGAEGKIEGVKKSLFSLAKIGIVTIGINLITNGLDTIFKAKAAMDSLKGYNPAEDFSGASRETVQKAIQTNRSDLAKLREELKKLDQGAVRTALNVLTSGPLALAGAALNQSGGMPIGGNNINDPTSYAAKRAKLIADIQRREKFLNTVALTAYKPQSVIDKEKEAGLTPFDLLTPSGEKDDNGVDKAKKAADDLENYQQRLNEELNAARLRGEEASHRAAMDLIRQRYEYEQELASKQRDNWVKQFTGAARSAASLIAGFQNELASLGSRNVAAAENVQNAQFAQLRAQQQAAVTAQNLVSGTGTSALAVGGAFDTGLRTGPSSVIGGSAAFHQDLSFGPNVGLKQQLQLVRQLAQAYDQLGRKLELSNSGVAGRVFPVNGSEADQLAWIRDARAAHRSRNGGTGRDAIDFYTPMRGENRFGRSVENTAMLAPLVDGASKRYFSGGAGGAGISVSQAGQLLFSLIHGRTDRPLPANGIIGSAGNMAIPNNKGQRQQLMRSVKREGLFEAEQIELTAAQESVKATEQQVKKLMEQVGQGFVLDFTSQIKEQTKSLEQSNQELELRNQLQMQNMRPEFIEAEIQKSKAFADVSDQINVASDALQILEDNGKGNTEQANRLKEAIQALIELFPQLDEAINKNAQKQAEAADKSKGFAANFKEAIQSYYQQISNLGASVGGAVVNTFKGLEDQLVNFVTTGKASFAELAKSILADMARIAIQQAVIKPLLAGVGQLFNISLTGNAMGNAYAKNGIVPFAKGGIVDSPTLFKFAKGTGLMGEAGPEAIIPLKRGKDGKLGVAGGGGGATTVNVSVDAKGSSVQGDGNQGAALGRAIASAVQAELVKQKRPGGILAG